MSGPLPAVDVAALRGAGAVASLEPVPDLLVGPGALGPHAPAAPDEAAHRLAEAERLSG